MIWYDFSDGVDGTVILLVGGQKHFPRHVLFPHPTHTKAICFVQDIPKIECVTYSPVSERENETRCIEKEEKKRKKGNIRRPPHHRYTVCDSDFNKAQVLQN